MTLWPPFLMRFHSVHLPVPALRTTTKKQTNKTTKKRTSCCFINNLVSSEGFPFRSPVPGMLSPKWSMKCDSFISFSSLLKCSFNQDASHAHILMCNSSQMFLILLCWFVLILSLARTVFLYKIHVVNIIFNFCLHHNIISIPTGKFCGLFSFVF